MRILASRLSTFLCRRRPGHVQSRHFSYQNDEGDYLSVAMTLLKCRAFNHMIGAHMLELHATDDERRMKIVEIGGAEALVNLLRDYRGRDYDTRLIALKALAALSGSDEAVGALHRAGVISVIKSTQPTLVLSRFPFPQCNDQEIEEYKSSLLKRFQLRDIEEYKSSLLKRFQDLGYDISSSACEKAIS
ncbi:hypothetical protein Pint_06667 [Pistacia integerrima]|uniref:Uncharacterized protein n=1 Tax=Pistacia integerrima TaxID=434235 RepID=A0ACC0ZA20_9ROSI|nr:hypothetical protein Pint_06667 [Pistacia integerrima]